MMEKPNHTCSMPRSRMDELIAIAEDNDGLVTSKQARDAGIFDSVLVRLAQRGRLERTARGVYRITHYPQSKFSQYKEALLWAEASQGPKLAALSHETAFVIYGISDANPAQVHITVPKSTRLRRAGPAWIAVHRNDLPPTDITIHEGLSITTIERTVEDVLRLTGRADLVREAIRDARRAGLIDVAESAKLKRRVERFAHEVGAKHLLREGAGK